MTKDELLGCLQTILDNFVIGITLPRIITKEQFLKSATEKPTFKGADNRLLHFDIYNLFNLLANKDSYLIEEYEKGLKRSIASEGHELILFYCNKTNQFDIYKRVAWFQFARIVRNVVSHYERGKLNEWPKDLLKKGITEVMWRDHILKQSMVGQDLLFTHYDSIMLLSDQIDFVNSELK